MDLAISRPALEEIARLAAARADREVCGLLLGQGNRVDEVRPCDNVAPDPRDSFEIDPVALIAAHRAARAGGPRLIGHFHSHPSGGPAPSPRDAAMAEPGSYWIIVAAGEARCWQAVTGGRFVPVDIIQLDNP